MNRQLRIIIGNTNDDFSANCAAALHRAGDWAILRPQQHNHLMEALRTEHPDLLILNVSAPTMSFTSFAEDVFQLYDIKIVAFYKNYDHTLEQAFTRLGVRYLPQPTAGFDRVQYLHRLVGSSSTPVIRRKQIQPEKPESEVTKLLHSVGISVNLRGFHYLRCAIMIAYEQGLGSGCMMSVIYPEVAKQMHSTPSRVERSIRHAILQAWENTTPKISWKYGIRIERRMTNSEFIAFAVEWLRSEEDYAARWG